MGRSGFSPAEANQIRQLLREKGIADRDRQKALRGQLRRAYGFYISDFASEPGGFTASDFDLLVSRGAIHVTGAEPRSAIEEAASSPTSKGEGESAVVLPDVIAPGLRVIFCGTAAGNMSARQRAYYAGAGNRFWSVLALVGFTPYELKPAEFTELPRFGIGLTDLAKFTSGTDREVNSAAFDIQGFSTKIQDVSPRAVAFNGKRAAKAFLGRDVSYGRQPVSVGDVPIFVLPSTSAAARGFWDESYWRELALVVK